MPEQGGEEDPDGDMEEIDPAPESDDAAAPTPPTRRRSTRRSAAAAAVAAVDPITTTGRKRRHDSAVSSPQEGEESDTGPTTKRARRADDSPEPSARVLVKDPPFPEPADANTSDAVPGKENGKRLVTADDSQESLSRKDNVEMVEAVETTAAQKETSAAVDSLLSMNGDSNHHTEPMETMDVSMEEEKNAPAATMPRAPEVDRLRLPSQHTPGKALKETTKIRDADIPVPARAHYDTPLHRVPSPHREQPETETPVNGTNGVNEPLLEQQPPQPQPLDQRQQNAEEEEELGEDPSPQRRFRVMNPFRDMFSPQRVERPVGYEEEEAAAVPEARKSVFQTTIFWIVIVLVLKACSTGYWVNTMLHSVVAGSKSLTVVYRGLLSTGAAHTTTTTTPPIRTLPPGVDPSVFEEKWRIREANKGIAEQNAITEKENAQREIKNLELESKIAQMTDLNQKTKMRNEQLLEEEAVLSGSLQPLEEKKASLMESNEEVHRSLRSLLEEFQSQKRMLDTLMPEVASKHNKAAEKIAATETLLAKRLERTEELFQMFTAIAEQRNLAVVGDAKRVMGEESEAMLLTLYHVELWQPSTVPKCPTTTTPTSVVVAPKKKKALGLPVETVKTLIDEFVAEIILEIEAMDENESLVEAIQRLINEAAENFPMAELVANAPKPEARDSDEPTLDEIRMLVSERLQVYQADQTGRLDYAALHNGAKILYHATSPSLVDNLPMLNRLATMLSIHSYGYGPEAALTPTWPEGALGQCWAFEADLRENRMGMLADLTVTFSEPIHVESVSIEHPPPEITDNAKTAIKLFKIVGYEGADATGHPWPLGAFAYDWMDRRKHARHEFKIPRKLVGQDVPMLQTITLAIDSNWGESVSCLYRFRVHGIPASDQ